MIIIWLSLTPCSSGLRLGPHRWRRTWRGGRGSDSPKFPLICLQNSFVLPPSLPHCVPPSLPPLACLTQLIETLNGKIRLCPILPLFFFFFFYEQLIGCVDDVVCCFLKAVSGHSAAGSAFLGNACTYYFSSCMWKDWWFVFTPAPF